MKDISQPVWSRALESLGDAAANLKEERYLVTLNRSYYAVFYAVTTLLFEQDHLHTKSHSGAHAKFRELFIKSGLIPKEASLWLDKTWELRQAGDYDFEDIVTAEEAIEALEAATHFIRAVAAYLNTALSN
ncbi:HEPN domain-containing protein [Fibrisoma montanum]|uniref:HEPN domain-containing protein n=1 Tax=Fibrisoma montanum TaxID=2305895 RepID=A0A418MBP0_9BACT|nr:HEPN domain-containing protein [Fibrisoma montanum]RIV23791.1 HEPN domain-containing protein [Fibrisoma montanum]